jgi:D-amino-acid oxidase
MSQDPEVVFLTPPRITAESILEKVACTRPMRDGRFNISLQQVGKKIIVNCYGHGGSGWTTLFGSIARAIELFKGIAPDPKIPIRVIGSGCMGLTSAAELARLGYQVAGISTKSLYDMPSWKAGSYFALVSIKVTPEEEESLAEIGLNTFEAYRSIGEGHHPYITPDAVRFMPVYCSLATDAGVEELERQGLTPSRAPVTLDFGNGVRHEGFVKYMTYFMNTATLMKQLTNEVKRCNIPITIETINTFEDCAEEVIFNCSGMGGRELNHDTKLIPVRGHLVALNATSGTSHMDYMIYTTVMQDGKEEYVYMFPKNVFVTPEYPEGRSFRGVLGGSFIANVDQLPLEEQQELDEWEWKRLLDRNCEFFWGHPFGEGKS